MRTPWMALILLVAALLLMAGCYGCTGGREGAGRRAAGGDKTAIVTTIFPPGDMAMAIGGDAVQVEILLPPGASPHTYEPSIAQTTAIARADLFILVGAGLDDWAQKMCAAAGEKTAVLNLADNIDLRTLNAVTKLEPGDRNAGGEAEHNDERGAPDPHFWLDPVYVKEIVCPLIAARLAELCPERGEYFAANLHRYQRQLEELNEEIARRTDLFPQRHFISYHSAWRYFAARYGLVEAAAIEEFPGKEPSARWIADLIALVDELDIGVIFCEPQLNPAAAQIIAAETGAEILTLDPIGGPGLAGRDAYIELMRYNLEIMEKSLGRQVNKCIKQ